MHHDNERGIGFAQLALAEAIAGRKGSADDSAPGRIAAELFPGSRAALALKSGGARGLSIIKAAVAGGSTADPSWAGPLAAYDALADEFISLARERSLVGRIGGWRNVPLGFRVIAPGDGFTAYWAGESMPKRASAGTFADETLPSRKAAILAAVSGEILGRPTDPAVLEFLRDAMLEPLVKAIDAALVDPANEGEEGSTPASITYSDSPLSGSSDPLADLQALVAAFPGDLARARLVGSPERILPLLGDGQPLVGGIAGGFPAYPLSDGSDFLALVDPGRVALGMDSIDLRVSTQASVEMDDAPTGTTATYSLFQRNAVGLLLEQRINWHAAAPSAAVVEYGS